MFVEGDRLSAQAQEAAASSSQIRLNRSPASEAISTHSANGNSTCASAGAPTPGAGQEDSSGTGFYSSDFLGYCAISDDGQTLALGAYKEDSSSTGVDSVPNLETPVTDSGAVYLYDLASQLVQ